MKLPENVREFFRRTGKIGAEKRHAGMSPARRREVARMAANTRWAKAKHKKKAGKTKSV
jgi:hypothetical protein